MPFVPGIPVHRLVSATPPCAVIAPVSQRRNRHGERRSPEPGLHLRFSSFLGAEDVTTTFCNMLRCTTWPHPTFPLPSHLRLCIPSSLGLECPSLYSLPSRCPDRGSLHSLPYFLTLPLSLWQFSFGLIISSPTGSTWRGETPDHSSL